MEVGVVQVLHFNRLETPYFRQRVQCHIEFLMYHEVDVPYYIIDKSFTFRGDKEMCPGCQCHLPAERIKNVPSFKNAVGEWLVAYSGAFHTLLQVVYYAPVS